MAVTIMPYVLPLLLGRTFNLDTMQIGVDIFPKSVTTNPVIIQSPVTETSYKIVDNAVESRDLLDVDGSFSLNVKGGIFKAGASGAYLADKYNRENTVEVAVKATYLTVTEQLPADAKPHDFWKSLGDAVGTHFVRSITYGGELIVALRLECNSTRDKQRIKAAVDVGGRLEIFDLGVEVSGEYMKDVAKTVESTQIKVFSSVPLGKAPNDMETLKETIKNFPDDLKTFNGGRGIPIKMELWPLSYLDPSRKDKLRNRFLEANLDSFEQKFDDLLNTKSAIADWMKVTRPLTPEQEKQVGDLYAEVQKVIRPFYDVIGKLDMTGSSDQLKPANDAYGLSIPGVYYKKYLKLRQTIAKDQGAWAMSRGNGATYIHWGKNNCSSGAETMSKGSALGPSGDGGGANFLCLTDKPEFGDPPANQKDAAALQTTTYQFPNGKHLKLSCSNCRLASRGTVQTFVGRAQCPEDWDFVYEGILMSGSRNSISTNFVCLDKNPQEGDEVESRNPLVPDWAVIPNKDDDEEVEEEKQLLFTCVVCAK
ncbi:uncharacterized protein LOC129961555 [Argiope bruennichi]|uniref:uncharacterized protein LOC129961555 n=1 Tax=Argiope bruennichi TaxID=94029 RepID=UPI002495362E|nr:uncharacterized protein LOC129961555 [Argiope bruennichi]XP_055931017.1 uncharacterized protein LOC129961555 [Argiope bruennichi]XP_055931018.1 uncharacterized protein LOC129961555 [Argiope bruennichi]